MTQANKDIDLEILQEEDRRKSLPTRTEPVMVGVWYGLRGGWLDHCEGEAVGLFSLKSNVSSSFGSLKARGKACRNMELKSELLTKQGKLWLENSMQIQL